MPPSGFVRLAPHFLVGKLFGSYAKDGLCQASEAFGRFQTIKFFG